MPPDLSSIVPRSLVVLGFMLTSSVACTMDDSEKEAAIAIQLAVDPATTGSALNISVEDGVARLTGQTRTLDEQRRAVEIAASVSGIRQVESNLTVLDHVLQEIVAEALRRDPILRSLDIRVTALRGTVRLESDKTEAVHRQRAVELVRSIDGVKAVEDFMR